MNNFCIFSDDRKYRYVLIHEWDSAAPKLMAVGLNPSIANEFQLDNTLRKLKSYCTNWGFGGFYMLNLFAFRATDPTDMKLAALPIGKYNDKYLIGYAGISDKILLMYGKHGKFLNRDSAVTALLPISKLYYLKLNKDATPAHCLYLKNSETLKKFGHSTWLE